MMDDRNLDAMLSAPLADVVDDSFSARIVHRIEHRELWNERLVWGIPALAACALAPFLPVQEFADTILRLGPSVAGSAALPLRTLAPVVSKRAL